MEKLASLLTETALYFRRADLFEDPLEGTHSKPTLSNRPVFFEGAKDSWINKTMPMIDQRTRKCVYVNCWHNNDGESMYMWDKYTRENKGIAIKSSLSRIRLSILDLEREFLNYPVNYINYETGQTFDANSFFAFFCKDLSYRNEKEVRFAFIQNFERVGDSDFDTLNLEEGILVPINNQSLIDEIFISPYTKDEDAKKIYDLLEEKKLGNRLQRSKL